MKHYYAFKGQKIISGPHKSRAEAKEHGKSGHRCRFCGGNAGGNTVCYTCACLILSPKEEEVTR